MTVVNDRFLVAAGLSDTVWDSKQQSSSETAPRRAKRANQLMLSCCLTSYDFHALLGEEMFLLRTVNAS